MKADHSQPPNRPVDWFLVGLLVVCVVGFIVGAWLATSLP
jgi:hypothetical protein